MKDNMKDKFLYGFGVIIGLIACIPLLFVRVIKFILGTLWGVIVLILLGIGKLESLLEMALIDEETEDDTLDNMIDALETVKKSLHK